MFDIGGALGWGALGNLAGPIGLGAGVAYGGRDENDPGYKDQGPDNWFKPSVPAYQGYNYTPTQTQNVAGQVKNAYGGIQADQRGLNAFRQQALRTGPSAWLNGAENKSRMEDSYARDRVAQSAAGQAAQARSQLAMRGGLNSGARERVAKDAARNSMIGSQQVGAQGRITRAGLGMQDEQQRQQALAQLPGMEIQALQPKLAGAAAYSNALGQDRSAQLQNSQFNAQMGYNMNKDQNAWSAWMAEQQNKANAANRDSDTQQWSAEHTGGLFNNGGFLGLGI